MPPNFGLPFIDAGIADTVRAAKLRDRRASLVLQTADNLYVGEASCALSLILSMGQSLLQNGLFQWARSSPTSSPAAAEFAADVCSLPGMVASSTQNVSLFLATSSKWCRRRLHSNGVLTR